MADIVSIKGRGEVHVLDALETAKRDVLEGDVAGIAIVLVRRGETPTQFATRNVFAGLNGLERIGALQAGLDATRVSE